MKKFYTSLLAVAFLCLATSCQKDEGIPSEEPSYTIDLTLASQTDWEIADEILLLVNDHRATLGLNSLKKDSQYASAYAVDHSQYMMDIQQVNHDNFELRSLGLRSKGAQIVGENVAYGYSTAEDVVNAWLNSPGHRQIIESDYTHSGFGVLETSNGVYYFTQLFYRK